jgi:hypothetical protein
MGGEELRIAPGILAPGIETKQVEYNRLSSRAEILANPQGKKGAG